MLNINTWNEKDQLDSFFSQPVDRFYVDVSTPKIKKIKKAEKWETAAGHDDHDSNTSQTDVASTDNESEAKTSSQSVNSVFNQNCFENTNIKVGVKSLFVEGWEENILKQKKKLLQSALRNKEVQNSIRSCIKISNFKVSGGLKSNVNMSLPTKKKFGPFFQKI